jgi:hypothetical protein
VEITIEEANSTIALINNITPTYVSSIFGDTGNVDITGYYRSPQIALRFYGGPVIVIKDESTYTAVIFETDPDGRMNMYRAAELGTAGKITSVSCRLYDDVSQNDSYNNFQVIMGTSNNRDIFSAIPHTIHVAFNVAYPDFCKFFANLN